MKRQIHWSQGLHLQPHHLQQFQLHIADTLIDERRLRMPYPYGVILEELDGQELERGVVYFKQLRIVMPGGTFFDFPHNGVLDRLDVRSAYEGLRDDECLVVSLGVPRWSESKANAAGLTSSAGASNCRYRVEAEKCADENTGRNETLIQKRFINARLVLETDDTHGLELVPLLRLSGRDRIPHVEFIFPIITLAASRELTQLIKDLAVDVELSRRALVSEVHEKGTGLEFIRNDDFKTVLALGILNRFSVRLPALIHAPSTTPFEMYLELIDLAAELAMVQFESDKFEFATRELYDHDAPYALFHSLSKSITDMLPGGEPQRYIAIPFVLSEGRFVVKIKDEYLKYAHEYVLGARTLLDRDVVNDVMLNQLKLLPLGEHRDNQAIPVRPYRHSKELDNIAGVRLYLIEWREVNGREFDEFQKHLGAMVLSHAAVDANIELTLYITLNWQGKRFSRRLKKSFLDRK